jgi:hypothetical protein
VSRTKQKAATGADAVTALYDPKHGNPQETARRKSNDEAAPLIQGYVTRLTKTQFPTFSVWGRRSHSIRWGSDSPT